MQIFDFGFCYLVSGLPPYRNCVLILRIYYPLVSIILSEFGGLINNYKKLDGFKMEYLIIDLQFGWKLSRMARKNTYIKTNNWMDMDKLHFRKLDKLCSPFKIYLVLEEIFICGMIWVLVECSC